MRSLTQASLGKASLNKAMSSSSSKDVALPLPLTEAGKIVLGPTAESVEKWRKVSKTLFLKNEVSGKACKTLLQSAQGAGAQGVCINSWQKNKNENRLLMNKFCKSAWPGVYWAEVPVRGKSGKAVNAWHPFLLPHEWVSVYFTDPEACFDTLPGEGTKYAEHIATTASQLGKPAEGFVALALHGDGVPVQGTHNQQPLDTFSINLPTSKANSGVRVPFTFMQCKHQVSNTMESLLAILHWSLLLLAEGKYPSARHDGMPWQGSDKERSKLHGELSIRGLLCEIRGDWDFYCKVLSFPAYNRESGMCWMCKATYQNFKTEAWRETDMTIASFFRRLARDGKTISVIFSLPGVHPMLCRPDWMHTVDLGIAADICGQVFVMLLPSYTGIMQQQCAGLWASLHAWYQEARPSAQLQKLVLPMFKPAKKAPKLSAKAAEIRALVPWLPMICQQWHAGTLQQQTALHLVRQLAVCYECINAFDANRLKEASQKLARLYIALEEDALKRDPNDTFTWRVKPKLHLFQHLCEFCDHNPRDFWCYADETAQHCYATLFERRGGKDTPGHNTHNALRRWTALTPFLRIPR